MENDALVFLFCQDFEEFVQSSGDAGVAVFSVSTLVNLMDAAMADMIASALARVPMRVVWKFKGDRQPATLGNNTLLASWLPQGDLLGQYSKAMDGGDGMGRSSIQWRGQENFHRGRWGGLTKFMGGLDRKCCQ